MTATSAADKMLSSGDSHGCTCRMICTFRFGLLSSAALNAEERGRMYSSWTCSDHVMEGMLVHRGIWRPCLRDTTTCSHRQCYPRAKCCTRFKCCAR
jgi:hypothetical protein